MDGSRFGQRVLLSLAVTLALYQTAWTQGNLPQSTKSQKHICKVYSLADLADDPEVCQWIVETIPQVIEPASWQGRVSYQAKLGIMTFSNTAAVHAQVEDFLTNVRKTHQQALRNKVATSEPALIEPRLVQVQFSAAEPKSAQPAPANKATNYPIPAPEKQPKHLFHFIIRYEGDGVLDAAMTELSKKLGDGEASKDDKDEKAKADPAKSGSMSQLLQFIIRYEGDGIIDSNVVELMKGYLGAARSNEAYGAPREEKPATASYSVPASTVNPGGLPSAPVLAPPPSANNPPEMLPAPNKQMPPADAPPLPR